MPELYASTEGQESQNRLQNLNEVIIQLIIKGNIDAISSERPFKERTCSSYKNNYEDIFVFLEIWKLINSNWGLSIKVTCG